MARGTFSGLLIFILMIALILGIVGAISSEALILPAPMWSRDSSIDIGCDLALRN